MSSRPAGPHAAQPVESAASAARTKRRVRPGSPPMPEPVVRPALGTSPADVAACPREALPGLLAELAALQTAVAAAEKALELAAVTG